MHTLLYYFEIGTSMFELYAESYLLGILWKVGLILGAFIFGSIGLLSFQKKEQLKVPN